MSGLFGTFNIAKRGINTSQATIDVTSHNIANANTVGYSRQRAKITTSRPMDGIQNYGQVGTGSQVQAIERVRDNFLDYQLRDTTSSLGRSDIRNNFLYEVENIFNEPSDTGISTLMGKFFDAFQELSKQPNSSNARTVAVQQTLALTDALNHTYTKLEQLQENARLSLKSNVTDVNSVLNQLDSINQQIMNVSSSGQIPNDLMDQRDLLLDELSYKFNITVDKQAFDGVNVRPTDANGMKFSNLVSASPNSESLRLSYISKIEQDPKHPNITVITYQKLGDMSSADSTSTIRVSDLSAAQIKELESSRILWGNNEGQAVKGDGFPIKDNAIVNASELMLFSPKDGEVAGNISAQSEIQGYMDELDKLAKSIAFSVNAIHSGISDPLSTGGYPDKDYMPFFVNNEVAYYNSNNLLTNLDETLTKESEISAKNITINKELLYDVMKLKTKTHDNDYAFAGDNDLDGEGDGARALAIASLRDNLIRVQDFGDTINSRSDLKLSNYGMTIQSDTSGMKLDAYFKDIIDKLGVQAQEASRQVSTQEELLYELEVSKAMVSGVSLDEEMANLIQYQHAYNANAKIISTIDELLNVIINGLKR